MSNIFVSYRRSDAAGHSGRLMDDLEREFPRSQIFRDLEAIEAGTDFIEAIENAVAQSVVLLAIIGPRWVGVADAAGGRRLDAAGDFVRHEIAAALRRKIRVIPVLVDGCAPLKSSDLPEEIQALARLQAHELSDKRWDYDVEQLLDILGRVPGLTRRPRASIAPVSRRGKVRFGAGLALGAVASVVIVAVAIAIATRGGSGSNEAEARTRDDSQAVKTASTPSDQHAKLAEHDKPTAPTESARTKPVDSAVPVGIRLDIAKNPRTQDGAWPVYSAIDQVGGNGSEKLCRIYPQGSISVTCRRDRQQKISIVLRVESPGCSGYVSSDAFVHDGMLPQKRLATLPQCP